MPGVANALNISQQGTVYFDGNFTFTGIDGSTAGKILTSNGTGTAPSFQDPVFMPFPWTDKAISFAVAANNGYFVSAVATATLPASPSQGDEVAFVCATTDVLTIQANTGQIIQIGSDASTTAGSAVSSALGDAIELVYRSADTTWYAKNGAQGIWTTA